MPERIQMTRQKPWRAEFPDAVIVARPTKWGNPFRIGDALTGGSVADGDHAVNLFTNWLTNHVDTEGRYIHGRTDYHGAEAANRPAIDEIREELAGRDLACWCPLDQPCHADVLLEIANG